MMANRIPNEKLEALIEQLSLRGIPGTDDPTEEAYNDTFDALIELHAYRTAAPLEKVREWAGAEREGRAVVLSPYAREGDPKPPCFYTDLVGAPLCLGMARENDDYPIANCQKCWYSEYSASEREEAMAALEGREGQG